MGCSTHVTFGKVANENTNWRFRYGPTGVVEFHLRTIGFSWERHSMNARGVLLGPGKRAQFFWQQLFVAAIESYVVITYLRAAILES